MVLCYLTILQCCCWPARSLAPQVPRQEEGRPRRPRRIRGVGARVETTDDGLHGFHGMVNRGLGIGRVTGK